MMDDWTYNAIWRSSIALPGIIFGITAFAYNSLILFIIGIILCMPIIYWMYGMIESEIGHKSYSMAKEDEDEQ